MTDNAERAPNFVRAIIDQHLAEGRYPRVVTRFPPEPNGYLHIGHAKSICLNFGLAETYGGQCHLRMDDTNPSKEETEYVQSIMDDVRWLGFTWGEELYYASDYFERFYSFAQDLIRSGKAYVDSLSRDELRRMRGSLTEAGEDSPYRTRSAEESLELLRGMREGEFAEGEHVLRAKIDMSHPNMLMRDPPLYRIMRAHHHRTGDAWNIYPMYDFAHCISDAIEGISHSICTLEFENNRELYDWILDAVGFAEPRPHQYEFARLSLEYTVMSKRKLLTLVKDGHVSGWDDPRMPTIAGLRRRGFTAEAIRAFADLIGVAKTNSTVDMGKLEFCIREDLNHRAPRVMVVLSPIEVVIDDMPEGETEWLDASYWPEDIPQIGSRAVPLTRRIYIEADDFMETPPKGYHRLSPGGEVRLRYGYVIRCTGVDRDDRGEIVRIHATRDTESRSGTDGASDRRVKGTIHWVSAEHALPAEVRLYDRLFTVPQPERADGDFIDYLNPESNVVIKTMTEPSLKGLAGGEHLQFERQGYFFSDPKDHNPDGLLVFNRVVGLRDSWAKKVARDELAAAPASAPLPAQPARTKKVEEDTRPDKLTRAEIRERHFEADPSLRARFEQFRDARGLSEEDAELCAETHAIADYFEAACAVYPSPTSVARWVINELLRTIKETSFEDLKLTPANLANIAKRADEGAISATAGKQVYAEALTNDEPVDSIIARLGLAQLSDPDAIKAHVATVMAAHPGEVEAYRGGKTKLFGFFIGKVLKSTGGRAHPEMTATLVREALDGE